MPHRLLALLVAALATALIAAGCGGDDDEGATPEDFTAEVTAACEEASTQLGGAVTSLQEAAISGDPDQLTAAVEDDLMPVLTSLQSDLEAITPPEEDADSYDQLLANFDESITLLEENPVEFIEASSGDQNELTQQAEELEAESDQLASDLGIPEDCGEASGGATGPTGPESSG
jgi:hypothetical protein